MTGPFESVTLPTSEQGASSVTATSLGAATASHTTSQSNAHILGGQTLTVGTFITSGETTYSALPSGAGIVAEGSTYTRTVTAGGNKPVSVAPGLEAIPLSPALHLGAIVTESSGLQITLLQDGSSLLVAGERTTTTLAQGQSLVIGGETVSLPTASSHIVVDGSSLPMTAVSTDPPLPGSDAIVTDPHGQQLTVSAEGSYIVIEGATLTTLLSAGAEETVGGAVFSVPTAGGAIMVDNTAVSFSTLLGLHTSLNALVSAVEEAADSRSVNDRPASAKTLPESGASLMAHQTTSSVDFGSSAVATSGRDTASSAQPQSSIVVQSSTATGQTQDTTLVFVVLCLAFMVAL